MFSHLQAMESQSTLWAAVLLGLGGSLHCLAMCGPLALTIPKGPKTVQDRGHSGNNLLVKLVYHVWRIISYLGIGLVVITAGKSLSTLGSIWLHQGAYAQYLAIGMVLMAVAVWLVPKLRFWQESVAAQMLHPVSARLMQYYQMLKRDYFLVAISILGLLHGLVPCAMVYSAAFIFSVTMPLGQALLAVLVFGITTSITLTLAQLTGQWLTPLLSKKLSLLSPLGKQVKAVQLVLMLAAALLVIRSQGQLKLPTYADGAKPEAIHCAK